MQARQERQNPQPLNHELQQVLEDNPSFLGTYTAWEPNIVDGNDAAFAGKT